MKRIIAVLFVFAVVGSTYGQQLGTPTALQNILNELPAVPIAGNNLKFQFGGDFWIARVGGENFMFGAFNSEDTEDGSIIALKQTHIWGGTAGRVAGGVAGRIAARWIQMPGPEFVFEYKAGPPSSFSLIGERSAGEDSSVAAASATASSQQETQKSGQILAIFGIGGQKLFHEKLEFDTDTMAEWYAVNDNTVISGTIVGVNVLFIGKNGFTLSTGIDIVFNTSEGVNILPIIGLGYVHYNKYYIGGILNFIPYPDLRYTKDEDWDWYFRGDAFLVPTFVIGYDFGNFLFGGQLSYMGGFNSGISGFRISFGVGVNLL